MRFLKRVGIVLAWIIGGFPLVVVSGFLLSAAGEMVTLIVGGIACAYWHLSYFSWKNYILAGISFFTMVGAGFALWINEN